MGVTEDTVLNWEKGRTYPSQKKLILLKERLDIDPFGLIEFVLDMQNFCAIFNLSFQALELSLILRYLGTGEGGMK